MSRSNPRPIGSKIAGSSVHLHLAELKARARRICKILRSVYPNAQCALNYSTPLELLVATILSAQCTDKRVNLVTPALFKRCPDVRAFALIPQADLEELIRTTGFYRSKATNIRATASALLERHKGEVPANMEALCALPGVGRKTANVVLGNAFQFNEGIVVDTHVARLSKRLGFTTQQDPVKIELELMKLVPKRDWTLLSHWLILHGRARCTARRPDCAGCEIRTLCPSAFVAEVKLNK